MDLKRQLDCSLRCPVTCSLAFMRQHQKTFKRIAKTFIEEFNEFNWVKNHPKYKIPSIFEQLSSTLKKKEQKMITILCFFCEL